MTNSIDFIIVGAAKSGTTTLHDLLRQHPEIFLPKKKELHFFDNEINFQRGIETYFKNFEKTNKLICGEITPSYMFFEKVPKRLSSFLGKDLKLIFILRNPVDRAISHYNFNKSRGFEDLSFEDAIEIESKRINVSEKYKRRYSYMSRGLYFSQINNFLKYYKKENIHVIIFEDFLKNKINEMNNLFSFLNLNPISLNFDYRSNYTSRPKSIILNKFIFKESLFKKVLRIFIGNDLRKVLRDLLKKTNAGKPFKNKKMSLQEKKLLSSKYFDEDVNNLENYLGYDIKSWKF
jgi:hypothetical protein